MPKYSEKLNRLLLVRGLARAVLPLAVLWGLYDWCLINWWYGVIFGALTLNYVLVYILNWVAPAYLNGPWRIRPWQTFIFIINAFLLPYVFWKEFQALPWGFIGITVLSFISLYVSTAILFYFNERMPMSSIFFSRRGGMIPHAHKPPATEA